MSSEDGDPQYLLTPVKIGTQAWHMYHEIARTSLFANEKREYYRTLRSFADVYARHKPLLLSFNGKARATGALEDIGNASAALRMVAVHRRYQGHGHGRMLGSLLIEFAKTQGFQRLCVNAAPDAVGYYASLGFKPETWSKAEYESFRQSRAMPVQMVKDLD
jgi:GNAT superfamily N-acetyltransferase